MIWEVQICYVVIQYKVWFLFKFVLHAFHRLPRETMKLGAELLTDMKKDDIIIIIINHKNNDNNYNNNNIIIWKQE